MESKLKLQKYGGSLALIIPKLYCEHLGIDESSEIILKDDIGKHGKFLSMWNKDCGKKR
jgi:antitoxin component of MazEF toxin-antitoxin module